jgi:apolipoprotein D and lipocalin family protein
MRKTLQILVTIAAVLFSINSFANSTRNQIPTVEKVELSSYLGLWHEVLRVENDFQDNQPKNGQGVCYNVTAEYGLLTSGKVSVKNTCFRNENLPEVANAKARIVKNSGGAKLKVNFTGILLLECLHIGDGDYWILALGPINEQGLYSWALVGSPNLQYGWLLSRTRDLDSSEIETALNIAENLGYDRDQFKNFQR